MFKLTRNNNNTWQKQQKKNGKHKTFKIILISINNKYWIALCGKMHFEKKSYKKNINKRTQQRNK